MIIYSPDIGLQEWMRFLFKYRGTNCSAVAKELGMSRQALYRMIKGETLKMDMYLKILDVLGMEMQFSENDDRPIDRMELRDVSGERVRQKIRGVIYDTGKMFCLAESGFQDHVNRILCWEPVADLYFVLRRFDDGEKPYLMLIESEEAFKLYKEYRGQ